MLALVLAAHAAPPACTREPDFADWPGGRTLRLDVDAVEPGEPVALTVTGAVPGERVEVWVGTECGLDCPPERDGACFQPSGGERIAERYADPLGTTTATVTLDPEWTDNWVVLQATAPDRASPAISQAIVVENGDGGTLGAYGEWKELSPLVVLGLSAANREYWWWPVAAGRRVQVVNRDEPDDTDCGMVLDGVNTVLDCWNPGAADVWNAAPVSWWFTSYDGWVVTTQYSLDIRTVPLDTPVDWYADLDADGYGDPASAAVSSATPVAGASPDARDCDDAHPDSRPNGLETCGDGIDQDCDGLDRPCRESPGATTAPAVGTQIFGARFSRFGTNLSTGDLDGDGTPELVGASEDGLVAAYPLQRRDVDEPMFTFSWGYRATAGDFTGDGQDDLAIGAGYELQILAGPLAGSNVAPSASLTGLEDDIGPAAGDLTGDGVDDLLVASYNGARGTMLVWNAPFSLDDTPDAEIPAVDGGLSRPMGVVSDADGDGLADVWTHEVCLHLSPLPPAGSVPAGCVDDGRDDNLAIGGMVPYDVDRDGYGDMVVGDAFGLRVLPGPFSGERGIDEAASLSVKSTGYWFVGVTPDRDGNGLTDLLVSEPAEVWSLSASGTGVVDASEGTRLYTGRPDEHGDGDLAPPILGGDFDADGVGDVAMADPWVHYDTRLDAGVATILWGDLDVYVPPLVPREREEVPPVDTGSPPADPAPATPRNAGCATVGPHTTWLGLALLLLRSRQGAPVSGRATSRGTGSHHAPGSKV